MTRTTHHIASSTSYFTPASSAGPHQNQIQSNEPSPAAGKINFPHQPASARTKGASCFKGKQMKSQITTPLFIQIQIVFPARLYHVKFRLLQKFYCPPTITPHASAMPKKHQRVHYILGLRQKTAMLGDSVVGSITENKRCKRHLQSLCRVCAIFEIRLKSCFGALPFLQEESRKIIFIHT